MSDEQHTKDTGEQELDDALLRENDEPESGSSPIPVFILFLLAALCFWGGVYLVHFGAESGFHKDAYTLDFDPHADVVVIQVSLYDRGAKVFQANCAACHQTTGLGVPGAFPPLAGSSWVTGHQETLARILINGMNGPVEVLGNTYNGNMPAFGPNGLNLKPIDIAGVLTYIRQDWGNEASDVTEATMVSYMDQYASRGTPWTSAEALADLGPEPVSAAPAAVASEATPTEEPAAH